MYIFMEKYGKLSSSELTWRDFQLRGCKINFIWRNMENYLPFFLLVLIWSTELSEELIK